MSKPERTFSTFYSQRILIVFIVFLIFPVIIHAQYFGRNKVQYQDFKFKVLNSQHFKVYYYPEEADPVRDATHMLERWYERESQVMADTILQKQPVILYANHPDFQQTNVISGLISQGTGGVTEGLMNRIVIPLTGVNQDNNHVLGHELVHAFQYDIINKSSKRLSASGQMPTWFIEGMAEYLSIGREDPLTAMWMRDAVLNDDVPSIKKISRDREYFPYRYGHALWAFLTGDLGDSIIRPLFSAVLRDGWKQGVEDVLGADADSLSEQWQQTIRDTYGPQLKGRTKPKDVGREIISGNQGMNLSPAISPDGKYIAFLSQRNLFTIDLFLADAKTGKVIKKLVSSNTDSHFDALRFMNSAGTWSPDGKKFAFVVVKNGDDQIGILDVKSREIQRIVNLDSVDAISHLAWSPDGQSIALSGTFGGVGNLYLYNVNTQTVQKLTDDKYSEIQPSWSPDGQTIVFASDRGRGTNFDKYKFSAMQLAFLDLKSGQIHLASLGEQYKHINPEYSPDGEDVYFIGNPDGFSDIYRYNIASEKFYRVTQIATGISGLTELSPAMSLAKQSGEMVFTVFNHMKYSIYGLSADQLAGTEFQPHPGDYTLYSALPPLKERKQGIIDNYMGNFALGLTSTKQFSTAKYHPKLHVLRVGQVGVGLAVNRFGAGIGGGINLLFSDILGNNLLNVSAQANGNIKDIGGQAAFINRDHRWNWGASIGHIPYRIGRTFTQYDSTTINHILIQQRIYNDQASLMAEYPLSTNRRLEFSTGYTRISYQAEADTFLTDYSGNLISQGKRSLPTPSALNMVQASAAYVGDYSFFGFTSPVRGRRYRFEVEPSFGSLQYVSAIADYRKYFFFRPLTLAFRLMHYGRYGKDAENNNLTPIQLGYPTWVRGYDPGTFSYSECQQSGAVGSSGTCPAFDRLNGSKVGIFNAELRLPLFGTEQFGLINFPYLPTELAAFVDGGVAWTQDQKPVLKWATNTTERVPVFSTGIAARVNLFGYIVGQVYYVYPFQRPDKGAYFGFTIAQGW